MNCLIKLILVVILIHYSLCYNQAGHSLIIEGAINEIKDTIIGGKYKI
jgi:hypothetical protein